MTINNDDLLVDLELDPDGERPTPVEKADTKPTPVAKNDDDSALSSLRKELDAIKAEKEAERSARLAAENEAHQAKTYAQSAKKSADASYFQLVEGAIRQAKARGDQIKSDIKSALDAGDYSKVSELQMEAAKIAARELQYTDQKADLEARAEQEKNAPKIEPVKRNSDPFEAAIEGMSDQSKAWLRQHRECVTDEVAQAKVVLADKMARRNGLQHDTPEYFAFVEQEMGYRAKAQAEPADDGEDVEISDAAPVAKRTSMPAAPVSRDNRLGAPRTASQVRLSKAEVEMAESLQMTPAEYAKWKIAAERDGRYTN
jgi:hypothetical protein